MKGRFSQTALKGTALTLVFVAVLLTSVRPASAASDEELAKERLRAVFVARQDLQQAFRADWTAVPSKRTVGLDTLEDWARAYGYREYPAELAWFAAIVPAKVTSSAPPRALALRAAAFTPVMRPGTSFNFGSVTATSVLVIDDATRDVLLSRNARVPHPLASITKLMTALVTLDHKVPMSRQASILEKDEVGGARLRVETGSTLTIREIVDAMLIGSANNAANALARSTRIAREEFIEEMNARAKELGLAATTFVDPSGIEVGNMSTAEDIAALGFEAFAAYDIRRATTTSTVTVVASNKAHKLTNTNELLNDVGNGLYVLGGKTGYLDESKWNFVVKVRDSRNKPVLVVILGADTKARSFRDAEVAAKWVWDNYRWVAAPR